MLITLVEDNISLAKGIAYRLQDAGHAVDVIHDGSDAEAFLRDDASDLVILDINLPGTDGLTLLRQMPIALLILTKVREQHQVNHLIMLQQY